MLRYVSAYAIATLPYSPNAFRQAVLAASGGRAANDQCHYLAAYLAHPECDATMMVVERPYVDRHYIEEYSRYYATAFKPVESRVTRIHFFGSGFPDKIDDALRAAAGRPDLC